MHATYYMYATVDVCQLPHRRGSCRKRLLRWYFDKRWNTCRKFVYRGCRGNGNRFETRQQCETKCNPSPCPVKSCALDCKYGLQLDGNGCPICKCLDPCKVRYNFYGSSFIVTRYDCEVQIVYACVSTLKCIV